MIQKDLLIYSLNISLYMLAASIAVNMVFLVFTRNFGAQDFFKHDFLFLCLKGFANISFIIVCIIQILILYFFVDYSLHISNIVIFYDILHARTQSFFYGKVYDLHFSKGFFFYNFSMDSFGLIIQFVGLIIGYLSYVVLDTRFFYKNIKYLSVFSMFSIIIILYTTTNNLIFFFLFYELLLLPAFFLIYFLSQARRATQASLYFII